MNYNISETKNLINVKLSDFPTIDSFNNNDLILIEREGQFYNSTFSKLAQAVQSFVPPKIVGDTISVDGIDVLIIAALKDGTWVSDIGAEGTQCIAVDKNHDLSYYVVGDDYVNSDDYGVAPGTFGYEWGGYDTVTGIQDTDVGTGLSNTNALIGMGFKPETEGWYVVWDKVEEFRQDHSDKWFVPSKYELDLIFKQIASLVNVTTSGSSDIYTSSSESDVRTNYRWCQDFGNGSEFTDSKKSRDIRARLCCLL